MNNQSDSELLRAYANLRSESAFRELVCRHLDFVYSAARRMVNDPHLAQDVSQAVFIALAKQAAQLADRPVLAGWLHLTARNIAAQSIRTDVRRRQREHEAATMNELTSPAPEASWEQIAPHLDAALGELADSDRDAILLRYYEKQSAAEIAERLGVNAAAAQKRVTRAVERLREFFVKRGITVGAGGLAVVISTNAVQSAPAGLAGTISIAALAGTAATTSTIIATATKAITMTTLQKTVIATTMALLAGAGIYEARQVSELRAQTQTLQQELTPLKNQLVQLQHERDNATNRLAALATELARAKQVPSEIMKLRGEVGTLREMNRAAGEKSALNKITSNPETRRFMREQQKVGMGTLYKDFAKQANLTSEQTDQFNELLADYVMNNVDLITQVLHDGSTSSEIDRIFSWEEAALLNSIQSQFGEDAVTQYREYSRDLINTMTAAQFAGELTGDKETISEKRAQLLQLMQQETAAALQNAGLPADHQVIPVLNFRNIASETQGDASLALMDGIYARVAEIGSSFLTPDELASFQAFRTKALNNSRTALIMNREMMAPLAQ